VTYNIKSKIAKLLSLAHDEGATEHEAARAMELATALMMKHNISENELPTDQKPKMGYSEYNEWDKKWHKYAMAAVCQLYSVKSLVSREKIRFAGRLDNIDVAEQTYKFICEQVERLYKVDLPRGMSKSDRAQFRRDFKIMCANRVYQRAQEIVKNLEKKAPEMTGSVVNARKQLMDEVNEFIGAVKYRKSRAVKVNASLGSTLGYKAGDNVRLNWEVR
jgi:hypothetical protein